MSSPRSLALGLIGAGRWGQTIGRVAPKVPGLRIAAVASNNPDSAERFPAPCRIVPDWQQLIEEETLDGLIVATPPEHHEAPAAAAMAAGLPVLIEKPLTLDLAAADRLLAQAKRTTALVLVDHIQLYAAGITRLYERLRDHGPIRHIRLRAGADGPVRRDTPVLWDWAPHDIAIALHLSRVLTPNESGAAGQVDGPSPQVRSAEVEVHPQVSRGHRETVRIQLAIPMEAAGGDAYVVPVDIRVSNALPSKERTVEVRTDSGHLHYQEYPTVQVRELRLDAGVEGEVVLPIEGPGPLDRVLGAFAQAIRTGRADYHGLILGREVVRLLDAAQSLASGDR